MHTNDKTFDQLRKRVQEYHCPFCYKKEWRWSESPDGGMEMTCTCCGYAAHFHSQKR